MKNILFDIETNGLLDELDRVHSLVMLDVDTGEMISCADQEGYTPIEVGLKMLQDIPAIQKVYGVSLNA